jgi:hypothetical protein
LEEEVEEGMERVKGKGRKMKREQKELFTAFMKRREKGRKGAREKGRKGEDTGGIGRGMKVNRKGNKRKRVKELRDLFVRSRWGLEGKRRGMKEDGDVQ